MVGLAGVTLALGCGGGPPHCGQVEPCGGEVAGTWKMLGSCFNTAGLSADIADSCPGASISISRFSIAGTLTFNADSSYSSTATETIKATEVVPLACFGGLVATCADLLTTSSPGVSISCVGTTVCTCGISGTQIFPSPSGTYTTGGSSLYTIDAVTGDSSGSDYCVQADLMHMVEVSSTMNMGPMGQATILSDLVAQKQ